MAEQDLSMQGSQGPIEQRVADAQTEDKNKSTEYTEIATIISDLDRRLRMLEERYGNLRKKLQLTDTNMIESERSFGKELKGFNEEILELKRTVADFDEKVVIFSGEMDSAAQKTDMKVIEKYLSIWDPNTFVTRKELREYLKSKKIKLIGGKD
jgi:predicted  nucleic acid-binding Zn-ribbon protein